MLATPALWAASMSVRESPTRVEAAGSASRPQTALSIRWGLGLSRAGSWLVRATIRAMPSLRPWWSR